MPGILEKGFPGICMFSVCLPEPLTRWATKLRLIANYRVRK